MPKFVGHNPLLGISPRKLPPGFVGTSMQMFLVVLYTAVKSGIKSVVQIGKQQGPTV